MDHVGKVGRQADNACDQLCALFDLLEEVKIPAFSLYLEQVALKLFFILEVLTSSDSSARDSYCCLICRLQSHQLFFIIVCCVAVGSAAFAYISLS